MNESYLLKAGIVGNIVSVVGVVICNKYIVETDGFHFMVFLSFLHFFFTVIGTRVLLWKEVFPYKAAQSNFIMPLSILSLLSVAFMNLNLKRNSVGFYQLSKLACIPVTLSIEYLAYNKTISRLVQMTLVPILFGVGFATIYDLDINMIGTIFAIIAVLATATSQIYLKQIQKPLDCTPLQILYHTSPLVCLGMLMLVPFFDNYKEILEFEFTIGCIFRIGEYTLSDLDSLYALCPTL